MTGVAGGVIDFQQHENAAFGMSYNITLKNLCIKDGRSTFYAGGNINLGGNSTVTNCLITGGSGSLGNAATHSNTVITGSTFYGGKRYAYEGLTIRGSTVTIDKCVFYGPGGGGIIDTNTSTVYISNSTITALQLQASTSDWYLSGTIKLIEVIRGANTGISSGGTLRLKADCVLDCTASTTTAWSGTRTIVVEDNVTIKPYGGGASVPIPPGTYTQYKFNRSGEFISQ